MLRIFLMAMAVMIGLMAPAAAGDAEVKAAAAAEAATREALRNARREVDMARERHANAEREINRHAARRSALSEAQSRLAADRTEADAAHESANAALMELPPGDETEARLASVRGEIEGHRRIAAQVRAEAQALAREVAELTQKPETAGREQRIQDITRELQQLQSQLRYDVGGPGAAPAPSGGSR